MPTPFRHTSRSLLADRGRGPVVGLAVVGALLAAWGAWFFAGRVTLYAVSTEARLEAREARHPVQAATDGLVIAMHVVLGQTVEAGGLLLEQDAEHAGRLLDEELARLQALERELPSLRQELAELRRAAEQAQAAAAAASKEAEARSEQAVSAAELAEAEARQAERLGREGVLSESERRRAEAEARQLRSGAEATVEARSRQQLEQRVAEGERRARLRDAEQRLAELEGRLEVTREAVRRRRHEVGLRQIRSPVPGTVAELAELRPGALLEQGDWVATVVPDGDLQVVADLPLAEALGRVETGQTARMRLDAYPWTQYGTVPATVSRVASDARDGRLRVFLSLGPDAGRAIPLRHGLRGTVEVEVERVAPAALVLRAAGRALSPIQPGS